MFGVSRVGDVINLYIAMFLVPDYISEADLGIVLPLIYMVPFLALPLNILLRGALKYINIFDTKGESGKIKLMLYHLFGAGVLVSSILAAGTLIGGDFVKMRLRFESPLIIPFVVVIAAVTCWVPLFMMACQALKRFNRIILTRVVGPVARLLVILLLLEKFRIVGYLGGMLAMNIAIMILLASGIRRYFSRDVVCQSYRRELPAIGRYLIPVSIMMGATALQQLVEPWVIRQRLPDSASAGYYIVAVFGNIPLWVAPAMTPFLFPLVSERHERGLSTRRLHLQSLGAVLFIGLSLTILMLFGGAFLLSLRESWQRYADYAPYMWRQAMIATLTVFLGVHLLHETACRRFHFLAYYVPLIAGEAVLLYVLMGWDGMQGIVPMVWWNTIDGWVRHDLGFIMSIMLFSRIMATLFVGLDILLSSKVNHSSKRCF